MKQVVAKVKDSDWRASNFFNEVAAAHYWNRKPSELGLCDPQDDPVIMVSYYQTTKNIDAYNIYLQQKEFEKINKK